MIGFASEVQQSRYFKPMTVKSELDRALLQERDANPARIPYFLAPSFDYPGKFILAYLPSTRPRHEVCLLRLIKC